TTNPIIPTVQETEGRIETLTPTSTVTARAAFCGSGKFEIGQSDIAIAHTSITMTSVVLVMLASDPGPVVVQYVSLQPTIGFTVHLIAPSCRVSQLSVRLQPLCAGAQKSLSCTYNVPAPVLFPCWWSFVHAVCQTTIGTQCWESNRAVVAVVAL